MNESQKIVKDKVVFQDRADVRLGGFIKKLRQRYGPLDPNVNEDYRNFLISEGKIPAK